jgi:hypothetical protein
MANIHQIASYLEAVLTIRGFDVDKRVRSSTPDSIFMSAMRKGKIQGTVKVTSQLNHDCFSFGPIYFVTNMETADRFLLDFCPAKS